MKNMVKRQSICFVLLVLCVALSGCNSHPKITTLTLSLAASLKDAMGEVETTYARQHPEITLENNYGSSGTLTQQIEQGAPVDLFLSAAAKPMDDVERKELLEPGTRADLLRNSLVLVAAKESRITDFSGLTNPNVRVIALGDPASVPAGQYGQQSLAALHLFDQIKPKLVFGKDVRQVLSYVQTGNADVGIVYATDALIAPQVRIVATAPENTHQPIVYPIAVLKESRHKTEAIAFEEFLKSSTAKRIFEKHGFTVAVK
ncbi:molybdate ABC transporter substrate-binding protein [Tunturiibacter gelidiferens]|uniref:molybdate ABC transporter substrate-binding protein n=1 Tax=Tunturiibacter gelidiferens TaxID=3069689 RepID=UPI003D9B6016